MVPGNWYHYGLTVHFEHDATVVPPEIFLQLDHNLASYDPACMEVLGWSGVDLREAARYFSPTARVTW